jgi:hypothetical protein
MASEAVTVTRDPLDLFKGGVFGMSDLATSVEQEVFAPGTHFVVQGLEARMVGKVLVREDGKRLAVSRGGTYRWIEIGGK